MQSVAIEVREPSRGAGNCRYTNMKLVCRPPHRTATAAEDSSRRVDKNFNLRRYRGSWITESATASLYFGGQ